MSSLREILVQQVSSSQVPSLGAAVILRGQLSEVEVTGVRKQGEPVQVLPEDKYHLGLCGTAMTATLAARLIKQGKLTWNTRVTEVIADLPIHPDYQTVTLRKLLNRSAGWLPPINESLWLHLGHKSAVDQRKNLVADVLKKPFIHPSEYNFSHADPYYLIAALMLETVSAESFEALMIKEVFEPLGMKTAGFGFPAKTANLDQPFGHNPDPVDPSIYGDEPLALSPCGNIHCSLGDWAKFATLHLVRRLDDFILPIDFGYLHGTLSDAELPMGWTLQKDHPKAGRTLWFTTMGSMFFATICLFPELETALIVASNIGGEIGQEAGMTTMYKLESHYI